jgi:hypothetical protein
MTRTQFVEFRLPWQLRYCRAWYIRQARWHQRRAKDKRNRYREWNLKQAAQSLGYARTVVEHYRATGRFDWLALCSVQEGLRRMRDRRWMNGLDIINCPKCFDVWIGQCENCRHNYLP